MEKMSLFYNSGPNLITDVVKGGRWRQKSVLEIDVKKIPTFASIEDRGRELNPRNAGSL